MPQLLDALYRIWAVDVSASSGFGEWDTTGTGRYESWCAVVGNNLEDDGSGFLKGWRSGTLPDDVSF